MKKIYTKAYKLSRVRSLVDDGLFAVPELQREFVWTSRKACDLLDSLYRNYPIGTLLVGVGEVASLADRIPANCESTGKLRSRADGRKIHAPVDGPVWLSVWLSKSTPIAGSKNHSEQSQRFRQRTLCVLNRRPADYEV